MVLLLGANGYIGSQFQKHLDERRIPWETVSHTQIDYTKADELEQLLDDRQPSFVINCAGYTGKPNVDACEEKSNQGTCTYLNAIFPTILRMECERKEIEWLHVSSGCIYAGGTIYNSVTRDLRPYAYDPGAISGFKEDVPPNFSFTKPPCSFYSGTKALGEAALSGGNGYVCRLRIPFNSTPDPRNYITKLLKYDKYYDNVNSISHTDDFVTACLNLMESDAPHGIYNVVNPGYITTKKVLNMMI